jgi:nucleotide-binding universal stress UspA family protein
MPITTIAVHVEPAEMTTLETRMALPLALARTHEAHVAALVFRTNVLGGTADAGGPEGVEETAIARRVQDLLDGAGVRGDVRGRSSFAYGIGEVFADQMRVSDIGMMAFPAGAAAGAQFVAAGGIFTSGRPLMLYPVGTQSRCARITIAWDASPASVRSIQGAMSLISKADSVTVVCITDDKEFRRGQSGAELTHLLARHGAKAEFHPLQRGGASVMDAVADFVQTARSDLLVMGAVRHSLVHKIAYGSATQDLLDRGPALPTLIAA